MPLLDPPTSSLLPARQKAGVALLLSQIWHEIPMCKATWEATYIGLHFAFRHVCGVGDGSVFCPGYQPAGDGHTRELFSSRLP